MKADNAMIAAALYATAMAAALSFGPRGPVYWDSFGYVAQAVSGQIGGLGLGRPVFVMVSHAVAGIIRRAGGSVFDVGPVLRIFWMAVSAWCAPLVRRLGLVCGLTPRAALLAGLAVALSPALAHASAAILTDAPSAAVTLVSLILAARAARDSGARDGIAAPSLLAFAAGVVLGTACGLREQAIVYAATLAGIAACAPAGRLRLAALMIAGLIIAAAAPVLYVWATEPEYPLYLSNYLQGMAHERSVHPYGARDLLAYCYWLPSLGPAALVFAAVAWWQGARRPWWRLTIARAVCVVSGLQLALLAGYPDIAYSPRYLVAGLAGGVAIPAGWAMDRFAANSRRRLLALLALLAVPLAIVAPVVRTLEQPTRTAVDTIPALLSALPPGSVVVTGQPCPAMDLYERLLRDQRDGDAPSWQHVCPGWEWPGDLRGRLDAALREGRAIAIDARPGAWLGREQNQALAEAVRYAASHPSDTAAGRIVVWR